MNRVERLSVAGLFVVVLFSLGIISVHAFHWLNAYTVRWWFLGSWAAGVASGFGCALHYRRLWREERFHTHETMKIALKERSR